MKKILILSCFLLFIFTVKAQTYGDTYYKFIDGWHSTKDTAWIINITAAYYAVVHFDWDTLQGTYDAEVVVQYSANDGGDYCEYGLEETCNSADGNVIFDLDILKPGKLKIDYTTNSVTGGALHGWITLVKLKE